MYLSPNLAAGMDLESKRQERLLLARSDNTFSYDLTEFTSSRSQATI